MYFPSDDGHKLEAGGIIKLGPKRLYIIRNVDQGNILEQTLISGSRLGFSVAIAT